MAWCRPGLELYLVGSRLIAHDTGERIETPTALLEAIERMSLRSLFYHVHAARRRTDGRTDDFSAWLEESAADPQLAAKLRAIDFYFCCHSRCGRGRPQRTITDNVDCRQPPDSNNEGGEVPQR